MSWSARVINADGKGLVTVEFSKDGRIVATPTWSGIFNADDLKSNARMWTDTYDKAMTPSVPIVLGAIDLAAPVQPPPDPDAVKKAAYNTALAKAEELQKLVTLGVLDKTAKEYTDAIAALSAAKGAL